MTIPLQTGIIYGPMDSRRFGRSLGINLLPENRKICTFECLYCQYGEPEKVKPSGFPSLEQIEKETDFFFSCAKIDAAQYDWITIAGNGEPTLHPDFEEAVDILIRLRDQYFYETPLGILSNSSTCHRPEIQQSLMKLDGRFMKLDAGRAATFKTLNQPGPADTWARIVLGLRRMRRIVIQSMFVAGRVDNTSEEEIEAWIKILNEIQPEGVQVYTIDRSPQHSDILEVSRDRLREIARRLTDKTHIPAFLYDPN